MSDELRMSGYHIHFAPTGRAEVDKILSAVACAGKAYHHTEDWNAEATWEPHAGNTPVEWIQNAANAASDAGKRLLEAHAAKVAQLEAQLREYERGDVAKALRYANDRLIATEREHAAALAAKDARIKELTTCSCGREFCSPLCVVCDNDD